jgi:hypothetical protein
MAQIAKQLKERNGGCMDNERPSTRAAASPRRCSG